MPPVLSRTRPARWRRWLPVVGWTASIWLAVPYVRALESAYTRLLPRESIGWVVIAVVVASAALGGVAIRRHVGRLDAVTVLVLSATSGVIVWWTAHLWRDPVEAVHFIQYGVLGGLLFRAVRPHRPDLTAHLVAAIAGAMLGTTDEVIQWLTPGRYWDLRDVVINGAAASLVQPAAWRLAPPERPLQTSSLRLPLRLAAAELALLTVCFAATPTRLERIAAAAPQLAFLTRTTNTMAEYGHMLVIEGVGSVKSRLTLTELEQADRERWQQVAALLDAYPTPRYGAFLQDVSPTDDPFAYEARVHVFSRDARLHEAFKEPQGSAGWRRGLTAAVRQHEILERLFARTLAASRIAQPPERLTRFRSQADPRQPFHSRVGRHLITIVGEVSLRWLLTSASLAMLLIAARLGRTTAGGTG